MEKPVEETARTLISALRKRLEDGGDQPLSRELFQELFATLCSTYGSSIEQSAEFPIIAGQAAVTGTDVMRVCTALLRAADLQVFELGMWQTWTVS
jgi:hypothetical protein